jgi:hypothetical protein
MVIVLKVFVIALQLILEQIALLLHVNLASIMTLLQRLVD